ncbi:MAG: hypothetical protein GY953_04830 [bacterium]|nr:hypothetical protein [bacterium]
MSTEIAANMDLLPTFAKLAGAALPSDRILDGRDIWRLMTEPDAKSPHEAFYYYGGSRGNSKNPNLRAVRDRRWKLHIRLEGTTVRGTALYDLGEDVGEQFDRAKLFPDEVKRLERMAQPFHDDLRQNIRPLGHVRQRP